MRTRKIWLIGIGMLGTWLPGLSQRPLAVSTQNSTDPALFQDVVHRYRSDRAGDAVNTLTSWTVERINAAADASTPHLSSADRMAAAILEAEVARAALAVHRSGDAKAVIEGALTLLHDAGPAPFGERLGDEPIRAWYYGLTSALVGFYRTTEASALVVIGLKEYRDDPLLLTARGTIFERRWDVINFGNGHSRTRTESLMLFHDKAVADFKRALQLRPDLTVAKLRLGQLYLEAGREGEAAPWLQAVAADASTNNQQYFVHLLLGRLAAKAHRLDAAAAEYHTAYGVGRYQAACIAVSQLEETDAADDCLQESQRDDPWVSWRTKADPDALPHLRAEARGE